MQWNETAVTYTVTLWCDHASLQRSATPTSQPQPLRPSQQSVPVLLHNVSIQAAAADNDDDDDEGRPNVTCRVSQVVSAGAEPEAGAWEHVPRRRMLIYQPMDWQYKVKYICFICPASGGFAPTPPGLWRLTLLPFCCTGTSIPILVFLPYSKLLSIRLSGRQEMFSCMTHCMAALRDRHVTDV